MAQFLGGMRKFDAASKAALDHMLAALIEARSSISRATAIWPEGTPALDHVADGVGLLLELTRNTQHMWVITDDPHVADNPEAISTLRRLIVENRRLGPQSDQQLALGAQLIQEWAGIAILQID